MNSKKVVLTLIAIFLSCTLLTAACDGSSGLGIGRQEDSPDPTEGVGLGQAGEDESLGSNEEMELLPLIPCKSDQIQNKIYWFEMEDYLLTWYGPPMVSISSPGYSQFVLYQYQKDKERWEFKSQQDLTLEATIIIDWPECFEGTLESKSNFTPEIIGYCEGNDIVQILEIQYWENWSIPIECELGKDACTEVDGKCEIVNYQLPFTMGGQALQSFTLTMHNDFSIRPEKIPPVTFKGGNAEGEKIYSFRLY